jgi:L-threonylcarbamoyladenylate synthase
MPDAAATIDCADAIAAAVAALRNGQIVVYPTETFYGLAADPFSRVAMEGLFAVKGREAAKTVALIYGLRIRACRQRIRQRPQARSALLAGTAHSRFACPSGPPRFVSRT